jgi:hypothetical protein
MNDAASSVDEVNEQLVQCQGTKMQLHLLPCRLWRWCEAASCLLWLNPFATMLLAPLPRQRLISRS